jgi:hypothetical protein
VAWSGRTWLRPGRHVRGRRERASLLGGPDLGIEARRDVGRDAAAPGALDLGNALVLGNAPRALEL